MSFLFKDVIDTNLVVTISGYNIELTAGDDLELVGRVNNNY